MSRGTESPINGRARIDSPSARRIELEYGEPLRAVLEGFAAQAPITRITRRDLADMLDVPYERLCKWLRRYGIDYPRFCTDYRRQRIVEGQRESDMSRLITANGETLTLTEWSRRLGCRGSTILKRIKMGWPEDLAVTKPIGSRYRPRANNLPKRVARDHVWRVGA